MVIEARIEKSQKTYKMLYSGEVDAIDQGRDFKIWVTDFRTLLLFLARN